ncbi:response regulator [Myroides odoratus]|uniref:Response regulator transcription factor n=1 Tax=Myroides odoratus TaxID=256 RepID=A0A9Q6ZGQ2_MYROD|nr:response regulator [Myroides odoratus]EHQ43825.1 two component transcriptional regulator, LuxR family [Myroides odoratus DSM 2801]QQU01135.1 response regulator transcription factor [Myroides odoratus]WQD56610.1 response regulator [Myroides odoratus]
MSFTLLIIDDHQMIVDWYKYVLQQVYQDATILSATSITEGVAHVDHSTRLDMVLVDYNLGKGDAEAEVANGVEFVHYFRRKFPKADVILVTGHEGTLVLYTIHKKIVPQALLLKIDVTEDLLKQAVQAVRRGERLYSMHANEGLKEVYKKESLLQEQNVQILLLLDKGFKIKEISETLFLSESAVNKRIAGLKQTFDVLDNGGLVKKVKEEGFI